MKIAVLGRGKVGGGLCDLWEKAGHDVARGWFSVRRHRAALIEEGAVREALRPRG